ncbi:MAG: DnaB-like helicase C-terminal domain-containing protein [Gammaproteobacteria bacterium]|nr:DnaB-like helicase C-terminal domain-containing protein [Gammaproteobacteria bacterium]
MDDRPASPLEPSTELKQLAVELAVPVIAVSQLNRRVEHRSPQYPRLSDLRGSSAIENDADLVIFLYREEVYQPHTPREDTADITVAKHRNGPTGTIWTFFNPETCTFKEI